MWTTGRQMVYIDVGQQGAGGGGGRGGGGGGRGGGEVVFVGEVEC